MLYNNLSLVFTKQQQQQQAKFLVIVFQLIYCRLHLLLFFQNVRSFGINEI